MMNSFNKVLLMGNLTRDPLVKQLPGNGLVAEFGIAASRRYRTAAGEDREETAFVDCSAFGRLAEVISQFCRKGKPLFIEGRLKYDSWDDKQSGARRGKLSVVVENFQFIGGRDDTARPGNPATPEAARPGGLPPVPSRSVAGRAQPTALATNGILPLGDERQFDEADIPF
jgi:single-strand DNA-binding protein